MNRKDALFLVIPTLFTCDPVGALEGKVVYHGAPVVSEVLEIDTVWAANRVGFDLHTRGGRQFVAYYDKDRMMTVASREVGSDEWVRTTLSSKLHWDSHNYVEMGIDEKGYVHVSGNMHVNPLVYYRSEKPLDVTTMQEVHRMTGEQEDRVTYPKFSNDGEGRLFISYRAGTCGDGNVLEKRFDTESMSWTDHSDASLFQGVEADNNRAAYHKKLRDSIGNLHYVWMWRWTPEVETCHQLCYAKTPDQRSWVNAFGDSVQLPHRPDSRALIVDDAPSKGGMHNSRFRLILDEQNQPILGYVKYDEEGLTQLYLARPGEKEWMIRKISDWDIRWKFFGGGDTMEEEAQFSLTGFSEEGRLVVDWKTTKEKGVYVVDPKTLEPADKPARMKKTVPVGMDGRLTDQPGLRVNLSASRDQDVNDDTRYYLKWETMKGSHGKHAPKVIPTGPTSKLLLLKVEDGQ